LQAFLFGGIEMNLNTEQMMKVFDVSYMTVYNWRNPKDNSDKPAIPFHTEKFGTQRHKIFFKWGEVQKWAKKNKVSVVIHPKDLGAY
jgi:hypothetical protein